MSCTFSNILHQGYHMPTPNFFPLFAAHLATKNFFSLLELLSEIMNYKWYKNKSFHGLFWNEKMYLEFIYFNFIQMFVFYILMIYYNRCFFSNCSDVCRLYGLVSLLRLKQWCAYRWVKAEEATMIPPLKQWTWVGLQEHAKESHMSFWHLSSSHCGLPYLIQGHLKVGVLFLILSLFYKYVIYIFFRPIQKITGGQHFN